MKWRYFILFSMIMGAWACPASAQEGSVFLALMPMEQVFIKGDVSKFRAMNWTKDGEQSGIRLLSLDAKPMKDVTVTFEGSGMIGDTDYTGSMLLTKDNVGYIKLSYNSFRKYYSSKGPYYPPFANVAGYDQHNIDKDLHMDIGDFTVEVGKGTPEDSPFSFSYERKTKDGNKDSTTFDYVRDDAYSGDSVTRRRKLAPIYLNKSETTDVLTVKGKADMAGFALKGEEQYSFSKLSSERVDKIWRSGSAQSGSDNKTTTQTDMPTTQNFSTIVSADRWTLNDKNYISFGYRFGHLRNTEMYVAKDYVTTTGLLLSGGTFRDGQAQNIQDTHTFTGEVLSNITDKFTVISRLKGELRSIHAFSETFTPISSSNQNYGWQAEAINENKVANGAGSLSLRYSGLARTALYADFEVKNESNKRNYSQGATSATGSYFFENLRNATPEGSATVGARYFPIDKVSLTTEAKYGEKTDKAKLIDGTETLLLINRIKTNSDSISERISWKPFRWFENSVKFKMGTNVYHMKYPAYNDDSSLTRDDETKMPVNERNLVYAVNYMPTDVLMFNASYSLKLLKVGGIGIGSTAIWDPYIYDAPPPATSNVYTYALSTSYAPTEKFCIFNSFEYSRSKNLTNADSFNNTKPPQGPMYMGTDAAWYNIDTGITWNVRKNVKIEPHYTYTSYVSFKGVDNSTYSANIVWVDVDMKW